MQPVISPGYSTAMFPGVTDSRALTNQMHTWAQALWVSLRRVRIPFFLFSLTKNRLIYMVILLVTLQSSNVGCYNYYIVLELSVPPPTTGEG